MHRIARRRPDPARRPRLLYRILSMPRVVPRRLVPTLLLAVMLAALMAASTELRAHAAAALPPAAERAALNPYGAGTPTHLDAYRGQVVLVNFWAPWCVPCRQEFPELDALQRSYHAAGFTVLGVTAEPDTSQVQRFVERLKPGFPILLDPEGHLHSAVDVAVMPTSMLLGRDGRVEAVYRGFDAQRGLAAVRADLARLGVAR